MFNHVNKSRSTNFFKRKIIQKKVLPISTMQEKYPAKHRLDIEKKLNQL
jgi:hypothetical protein